jgi:hypothetical protein
MSADHPHHGGKRITSLAQPGHSRSLQPDEDLAQTSSISSEAEDGEDTDDEEEEGDDQEDSKEDDKKRKSSPLSAVLATAQAETVGW